MKKLSLALLIIFVLSLINPSAVSAQTYYFSVDSATIDVYFNADGTTYLVYVYGFSNDPSASPIDFVDIGLPNGNFSLSNVVAEVDGKPVAKISNADPQYLKGTSDGVTLELGSNAIQPGMYGVVTLKVYGLRKMMYIYNEGENQNYASVRFIPNYFGSEYVKGTTDLMVTFHLPPGIMPEEPRWEQMGSNWPGNPDPETGIDADDRVYYSWQSPIASTSEKYEFAAAFPAQYVPEEEVYQAPAFKFDPSMLICPCFAIVFLVIIGFSFYSAIWGAKKRKLKYLPPKISIEGHGIKRGLTAVEAAIVMEQPMDKVLTMILFGVIKKSAASITSRDPLVLEVASVLPQGLQPYEMEFLKAAKLPPARERQKAMQEVMVGLVKSVSEKMKGFSRKETIAYYDEINKRAWAQVEAADTPEVKGQKFDENLEWTMLDKNYDDHTRETFNRGPVFLPMWWGSFDPTYRGTPIRTTSSTPSTPSMGGSKPISVNLPTLPGADFASSMVTGVQTFASGVVGDITNFTSGITNKTNPPPPPSTRSYRSSSGGGGGGRSCACACACAGCACACAGGGR